MSLLWLRPGFLVAAANWTMFMIGLFSLPVICILYCMIKQLYNQNRTHSSSIYVCELFNSTAYATAHTAESQCSWCWSFKNVHMGFWSGFVVIGMYRMFSTHDHEAVVAFLWCGERQQFRVVPCPPLSFVMLFIFELLRSGFFHCWFWTIFCLCFCFLSWPDCRHVANLRWDYDLTNQLWHNLVQPGQCKEICPCYQLTVCCVCPHPCFLSLPFLCRRRRRESERPRRRQH